MTKKPTLYSSQKASLFNKTSRLHSYQIKAPVHWGVNATKSSELFALIRIKAPVHWGVNATRRIFPL